MPLPSRTIPSTGESLPVYGMGSWKTFDAPPGPERERMRPVLDGFFAAGGTVIDTSPMYGRAEQALGELLPPPGALPAFVATKVWTRGSEPGIAQMEESFRRLRRPVLDLLQVHNLVDWREHVPRLKEWQAAGRIRYWGLTHYHAGAHAELERVAAETHPDFIQINYSLEEPEAGTRILPFAAAHGIAVLANRPFGEGALFRKVRGRPLPESARAAGLSTWSALFLDFVLAHPAVTCVIPATGNTEHLAENLAAAAKPPLPDGLRRDWVGFI
jgi:aryl-alcohol dehydrogenase-like predicted oxidoreductase